MRWGGPPEGRKSSEAALEPRGAATGHPRDESLGSSCPHPLAGGCWVPRVDAQSLSSSHGAMVMPVVLPV